MLKNKIVLIGSKYKKQHYNTSKDIIIYEEVHESAPKKEYAEISLKFTILFMDLLLYHEDNRNDNHNKK